MGEATAPTTAPEGEVPEIQATEAQLALARARLHASMSALRTRVDELHDVTAWVRQRPLTFLGAAFALGLLLGWGRRSR